LKQVTRRVSFVVAGPGLGIWDARASNPSWMRKCCPHFLQTLE
jgi:hypothetical protein